MAAAWREDVPLALQAYLRHSARQQYEAVSLPPFTLFFHPPDPLPYFNYAIPDGPCAGELGGALASLRAEFAARDRRPRLEFVQDVAPALPSALRAGGFVEQARQPLMICTAGTVWPAPEVPGLALTELTSDSALSEVQDFVTTQRRGFDPHGAEAATVEDAEQFLRTLGSGRAFVAWLEGQPVGVGMVTSPFDGVTELAGLATLAPFRGRGIATLLAARAVESALARGVELVCLTAADERAGRVYERVGFSACATMLAYVDSQVAVQTVLSPSPC